MTRFGRVLAVLAVVTTILLGFSCGGPAQATAPVFGHHHHSSSGVPSQDHAILIHPSCCIPIPVSTSEAVATNIWTQSVAWFELVEPAPSGRRISPDTPPPKTVL